MQYRLISDTGASRLIIIFAGWAMDWHPFATLSRSGYDIAAVWDYETLDSETLLPALRYDEICILGWSMGVSAAAAVADVLAEKLTRAIAVNGTPHPVDDTIGIPATLFQGTLDALSPVSLRKFYRRVAGGASACKIISDNPPERDIEQLRRELQAIAARDHESGFVWDHAFIGASDAIFPPENQRNAWHGTPVTEFDGPHLPDFQKLLDRCFIDKERSGKHFATSAQKYEAEAVVQTAALKRLDSLAGELGLHACLPPGEILEIGPGTGMLTRRLMDWPSLKGKSPQLWDIASYRNSFSHSCQSIVCDAELRMGRMTEGTFALIASASAVQWFGSMTRFLGHARRALCSGGYLMCVTYVRPNFPELEQTMGVGLLLPEAAHLRLMLAKHFEILHFEEYTESLCFSDPADLFRHLKATGVNSLGKQNVNLRSVFPLLPRDGEGKCTLTYHPAVFIVRKND